MEILKLLLIIVLIAILMWRKVDLGLSLLIGSILMGASYGMNAKTIAQSALTAVIEPKTIELVFVVFLIIILGKIMLVSGNLEVMVDSLGCLIRDRRLAMVIPPALIGLLPAPGGAMLSAPMVDESAKKLNITAEQKTYINFWFRHLWEYCWPLYPGLIIAAAVLKVPLTALIKVQFPLAFAAILAGVIFGLLPIKTSKNRRIKGDSLIQELWRFIRSIWPIWLILIGLMLFRLPILIILSVIIIIMSFPLKVDWQEKCKIIAESVSWRIALLLFAVMIFKQVVMDSAAVESIPAILQTSGISPIIPAFAIPFLLGILTGVNQAYIGVSFPLLLPLFGTNEIDLQLVMFAYAAGFAGVLLSPVHLCLMLTKEYYGAKWGGIYRLLLPSVAFVLIASFILMFI